MRRLKRLKWLAINLIIAFILFYAPHSLVAQSTNYGSLIGYIYEKDGTTPVKDAIVLIRNTSNGSIYESEESNKQGISKIDHIEDGLYILGIWTKDGGFNIKNIIGIYGNETIEISFVLGEPNQEKDTGKKDERCPRGKWYYPEVMGECDEGYSWNPKRLRCECKRGKGIGAFFVSPVGIATVLAATFVGAYGIIKLTEKEAEVSPFK
ncbi:MAG: hypothetical protein GTN73_00170 [Candidatus Aminicenantes bacterium]|nr:hypothetical protein [Candidatus Aminicenantes bacterium]